MIYYDTDSTSLGIGVSSYFEKQRGVSLCRLGCCSLIVNIIEQRPSVPASCVKIIHMIDEITEWSKRDHAVAHSLLLTRVLQSASRVVPCSIPSEADDLAPQASAADSSPYSRVRTAREMPTAGPVLTHRSRSPERVRRVSLSFVV